MNFSSQAVPKLKKQNKLSPTYSCNNSASKEEGTSQVPVTDLIGGVS